MRARSTVIRHLAVVAIASAAASSAWSAPRARVTADLRRAPGEPLTGSVCSTGENHCHAHVGITAAGQIQAAATPAGFGPAELQAAYNIDPNITTTPTVAIVDAYGYAALESDLAQYRQQYGLPACTIANGCLRIVNQDGAATPLPDDPPADDDWTIETALDVDMASAACPRCKILVVQGDSSSNLALYTAQKSAAALRATVISDSWGSATQTGQDLTTAETYFDHPGIAQFFSGGDRGYDEGGQGPTYPSTSAHVIAVGGTALTKTGAGRGWAEVAWTKGGSSCSYSIAKPAYQPSSPCNFRAATDISAVGDPATGVAVYNAANGGWMKVGGTSAAAPLVAAMFAATGHGDATAQFIAQHASLLNDVTSGTNGPCSGSICNAGPGWDGPTGWGTPNAAKLAGATGGGGGGGGTGGSGDLTVAITSPADGATVAVGFMVSAAVGPAAVEAGLGIDGKVVATTKTAPVQFTTPTTLANGLHEIAVAVADAQGATAVVRIHVTVFSGLTLGGDGNGGGGDSPGTGKAGCQASRTPGAPSALFLVGLVALARRRRRAAA